MTLAIEPVRRGNLPQYLKIVLGLLIIFFCTPKSVQLLNVIASNTLYQFIKRLCFLPEEILYQLKTTRYQNDIKKLLLRVVGSTSEVAIFVVSLFCVIISMITGSFFDVDKNVLWVCLGVRLIVSGPLVAKNPFIVFCEIGEKHSGLFYGISMAYSYFHGYLDIILPNHGRESDKCFRDRAEEYVMNNISGSRNHIKMPDARLYVLVPASGTCLPNVAEQSGGWMEKCKNLDSVILDRAGVRERKYHNTVYRIKDPDDDAMPVYVVAEYATPLLTYIEACKHFISDASWRTYKRDTVISFYETCINVVSMDPLCKREIRFVYYEDELDDGEYVNVGKLLLECVREKMDQVE